MQTVTDRTIESVLLDSESWNAEEVLGWACAWFGNEVAIASAFGPEGIAMIDLASRIVKPLRVFILDTDFLFPETHELIAKVESRYGIRVERVGPLLSPEAQERLYGPELWQRDPNLCCRLRKIEPLRRRLTSLRAWITAIRRGQTSARANARKVEWDTKFSCWKINPLVDWTEEMVWDHIHRYKLPYNALHDRNYPSVGCAPCTRAVLPGENARAGRWSGFNKTECGLHEPSDNTTKPHPNLSATASHD